MLSGIVQNAIMLSVQSFSEMLSDCHYAECHYVVCQ